MRFPFFTTFIIFVILTQYFMRKSSSKEQYDNDSFWEKELKANRTRKKSLDALCYITIPYDKLPFGKMPENEEVLFCEKAIRRLEDEKIVNLTGYSNTDLKLEWGAPNITALTAYDQNYTTLVTTLQKWGKLLYDASFYEDAQTILEFSLSTRTDITATYRLLLDMYRSKLGLSKEESERKIKAMVPVAESLKSLSRDNILELLNNEINEKEKASPT